MCNEEAFSQPRNCSIIVIKDKILSRIFSCHKMATLLIALTAFVDCIFFSSYAVARGGICSTGDSANTGGCVAYEDEDFNGRRQDLGPNRIYNYVGDRMNDKISSFRISSGCRIIAWEHRNRGG